jgi:hypothetical protein
MLAFKREGPAEAYKNVDAGTFSAFLRAPDKDEFYFSFVQEHAPTKCAPANQGSAMTLDSFLSEIPRNERAGLVFLKFRGPPALIYWARMDTHIE